MHKEDLKKCLSQLLTTVNDLNLGRMKTYIYFADGSDRMNAGPSFKKIY